MDIQTEQLIVELKIRYWTEDYDLGERITEVRNSQKIYLNDIVEVQQVVDIGKVNEEFHRILILIKLTRDLDNLGEKIIL